MSAANSHSNAGGHVAVAIQERAICENPDAGPDGVGVRDDGAAYTLFTGIDLLLQGGRIAIYRTEIPLPIDERVTKVPALCHTHERIIHGAVSVRVIALEHFTDDPGTF